MVQVQLVTCFVIYVISKSGLSKPKYCVHIGMLQASVSLRLICTHYMFCTPIFLVGGAAQLVRPARRKGGTPTQGWWHCPCHGARPFRELYAPGVFITCNFLSLFSAPCLAASSAASFPSVPMWALTHASVHPFTRHFKFSNASAV